MAYTTLAEFNWGSSPKIPLKFEYDRQRSGTAMQYKFRITVKPMASSQGSFGYKIGVNINLNGSAVVSQQIKDNSPSVWASAYTYESAWFTVANKTTGTTPATITITTNAGRGNSSWSYSLAVDPGKSTMTFSNFTIGTSGNFSIARNNSNFTHTITYSFGSASGTITTKTTSTTVAWTPPITLYNQIIGKTKGTGTVTLETFSGNTSLGSNSYTLTINAATVYNPPSLNGLGYERGTLDGSTWTASEEGLDVKVFFTAAISSISGNTTSADVTIGTDTVFSGTITSGEKEFYKTGIGTDNTYMTTIVLTDTLGASKTFTLTIATSEALMNKNFDIMGIAFGKIAEKAKTVEIAPDWALYFGKPLMSGGATSENIMLLEDASHFRYIEIFYRDNDYRSKSVKISAPLEGESIDTELSVVSPRPNGTITIKSRGIRVSGTQITTAAADGNYYTEVAGIGATPAISQTNHIFIYRVIGWR